MARGRCEEEEEVVNNHYEIFGLMCAGHMCQTDENNIWAREAPVSWPRPRDLQLATQNLMI